MALPRGVVMEIHAKTRRRKVVEMANHYEEIINTAISDEDEPEGWHVQLFPTDSDTEDLRDLITRNYREGGWFANLYVKGDIWYIHLK